MKELCETLESAYNLLSSVFVSGENVDKVAVVRQYLRDAYQTAKDMEDSRRRPGCGKPEMKCCGS